jgi:ATP-dependent helicase/DNAse subunit B
LIAIEEQTRQLIAQALRRLIAADFAVAPSRFGNESPCTFCDRQRVCQVDYTINRPRHMKPMNRAEVMQQLGFQADRRDE